MNDLQIFGLIKSLSIILTLNNCFNKEYTSVVRRMIDLVWVSSDIKWLLICGLSIISARRFRRPFYCCGNGWFFVCKDARFQRQPTLRPSPIYTHSRTLVKTAGHQQIENMISSFQIDPLFREFFDCGQQPIYARNFRKHINHSSILLTNLDCGEF